MNTAVVRSTDTTRGKAAKQCRILIVDDDALNRRLITRLLGSINVSCSLILAEDGQQAWSLYKQQSADLIITDNSMPLMDGMTFVRALRREGCAVPIIMLSGSPDIEHKAYAAGVSAFLEKPVDIHHLTQAIGQLLPHTHLRNPSN
jgi:CheY-like chemotaxis protein